VLSEELSGLAKYVPFALGLLADSSDYQAGKRKLKEWAAEDPIDALAMVVIGGGIAFYVVEREVNPNCKTAWDGMLYMATALSVGYDNLFPCTPAGHALAVFAQTFGPALANAAFEPTAAEKRADAVVAEEDRAINRAILARLEDIVRLLER
jgi:voltage-gated potassium channel